MLDKQIEIDELIRTAYAKGHAEGMLDSVLAIHANTEDKDTADKLAGKARLMLECLENDLADARIAGYQI